MPDYVRMKPVKKSSEASIILFAGIGVSLIFLLVLAYGIVVSGWVLTVLWGWFVVPVFKIPALSLPVAIGISGMIRLLTYTDTSDLQQKEQDSGERRGRLIGGLLSPWFLLLLGWIVHFFV